MLPPEEEVNSGPGCPELGGLPLGGMGEGLAHTLLVPPESTFLTDRFELYLKIKSFFFK